MANYNTDFITITSLNTRGIMGNINYVAQICKSTDILCLQEHHLFEHNVSLLSSIDTGIRAFSRCNSYVRNDGKSIYRGGTAIIWKAGINHQITKLHDVGDANIIGVKIVNATGNIMFVFNVYLPSVNHNYETYQHCLNTISNIYEYYKCQGSVIIVGDFNTGINTRSCRSIPNTNGDRRRSRDLETFMVQNNLCSLITHEMCTGPKTTYNPVYGAGTQIDHIITDACDIDNVVSCWVHDDHSLNTSDHNALSVRISYRSHVFMSHARKVYKWQNVDTSMYASKLDNSLSNTGLIGVDLNNSVDIDAYCEQLISCIQMVSDKCIPKSNYCSFLKPYWSKEIKLLHKEQKRFRSTWLSEGRPRGCDYESYVNYKKSKTVFANALRNAAEEYEETQYDDINVAHDVDIRKFWKFVNKKKLIDNDFHIIKDEMSSYSTPETQMTMWIEHFMTLLNCDIGVNCNYNERHKQFIDDNVEQIRLKSDPDKAPANVNMLAFTNDEIINVCKALPTGKAPGIDLLTYEHFKYAGCALVRYLTKLFNSILKHVYIPKCFKQGLLFTMHKGHGKPKDQKASYRGITLLPVINKMFEKCILIRMEGLLAANNFPPKLQHAVRKKNNNVTLSFAIQETINYHIERNGKVFACLLDIKQAFNKIWWNGLFYKMFKLGITDKLWLLFNNWFKGSTCSVLYNGTLSDPFNISCSIKQGGVLSM